MNWSLLNRKGPEKRTWLGIIIRWEIRRIPYNISVLVAGLSSIWIISKTVEINPGEDIIEPMAMFFFAICCNIGYTAGWISEIVGNVKNRAYGPRMYLFGLSFSVFLALLPGLIHFIGWIARGFSVLPASH